MRLLSLLIFIFILVAFGLGSSLSNSDLTPKNITGIIDNTNLTQINLNHTGIESNSWVSVDGIINIIESYLKFVITFTIETMKMAIGFGYENPQYFEIGFISNIIYWIIVLIIISLLIKPVTYLIILLVLFGIWIKEKISKKKND